LARAEGDRAQAGQRFKEALATAQRHDVRRSVVDALVGLGALSVDAGELASAVSAWTEALRHAEHLDDRPVVAMLYDQIAACCVAHGRTLWAARLLGAARGLRDEHGRATPPAVRRDEARLVATLRAAMGEPACAAALLDGRSWSHQRAIAAAQEICLALLPRRHGGSGQPIDTISTLTPRELEVLRLLAAARSDRTIAEQLGIGVRTVETHVANILDKLGVDSRTAAATFAVRSGLADETEQPT
jgi:non-specific serine/threonine protein kinase